MCNFSTNRVSFFVPAVPCLFLFCIFVSKYHCLSFVTDVPCVSRSSGRSGLLNHKAVHKLRGLMLQCLYVLMRDNHTG